MKEQIYSIVIKRDDMIKISDGKYILKPLFSENAGAYTKLSKAIKRVERIIDSSSFDFYEPVAHPSEIAIATFCAGEMENLEWVYKDRISEICKTIEIQSIALYK